MTELPETYIERPMGVTDASVIAVAERLGITEIACTDRTDFRLVHPRHVEAFTLLPEGIGEGEPDSYDDLLAALEYGAATDSGRRLPLGVACS